VQTPQIETSSAMDRHSLDRRAGLAPPPVEQTNGDIWASVDRLIDRGPTLAGLRAHRLHLLAARRWSALGRPLPRDLMAEARTSGLFTLVVPMILERARAAYEGPMVLMKGLEVAALYPDPALRPFHDVDLLVADAAEAHRALISAGFQPVANPDAYYADRHHLRPLCWPALPLVVEIHKRPEWPTWTAPPATEELLSAAIPASAGVDGLQTLAPSHHALVLAAHSWTEAPLRRAIDLVDVAAVSAGQDRDELGRLARRWDIGGVWETMIAAADALLFEAPTPWSMRLWARDLLCVRDRTVLENHLRRLVSSFWALPPRRALRASANALVREVRPAPGESRRTKLARAKRAIANPLAPLSEHNGAVERRAADFPSAETRNHR
jgi:Uncharacterised nucleotidyltransferase